MSLVLLSRFTEQTNTVVPLAQSASKNGLAIRVASGSSATLGTLTAAGAGGAVQWSIAQNPSWVTLGTDTTGLVATIAYTNALPQTNAFPFYVAATDGVSTVYFPIFLEVRAPFRIVATTGASSFSVPSFDSTVADIVFQGVGLNGVIDTGVQFLAPTSLPSGLRSVTSDGSAMALRVQESSATDVSGGLALWTGSPTTTQISLSAYKPGTLYDNPSRCFTGAFTIESLTAKQGTIDVGLTAVYATAQNAFVLTAFTDFLNGQAQAVTYEWDTTGTATGNITSGGTSASTSMVWTPATSGTVGFTFKVKNSASGAIVGEAVILPTLVACAPSGSWEGTSAIKLSFANPEARGWTGDTVTLTVSTPAAELAANETVTVSLHVSNGSAIEAAAAISTLTVTLTSAQPSANIPFTFPEGGFNQKWIVSAAAANALTNPTRTGYAQVVCLSNGDQPLTITSSAGFAWTSNVGQNIPPVTLQATNRAGSAVPAATFSLAGAPDGLFVSASGQISGNALVAGTYSFLLVAEASGYARSYSAPVTLTAAQFLSPLVITDAIPSVPSLPDNQPFLVSWGYAGTPTTLNLQQGFTVRSVLGATEATATEVGNSVLTVFGTSFFGDAYSVPAMVLSSSITANGALPDAPTVGILDENFHLTLQWTPETISGNYLAYKAWNIYLKPLPNGVDQLQTVIGQLPTGLEAAGASPSSRIFTTDLSAGDWQVHMQALTADTTAATNALGWDQPHEFPTAITSASISFDNGTVSLGQTLTISLDPNYIGADTWQAVYPDGTTSGWMPISVKSLAKTMSIAGNQPIVLQTQRSFASANPPVKLIRQVTKSVYVMNQQFKQTSTATAITGNLGFGGEDGFEIIDASASGVALAPYAVVVRALVRDRVSNELKVMVATSRTSNASSLLGTMAIDVFPIAGRPRLADLIDPAFALDASMVQTGNPARILTSVLPNVIVGKPMADFPLQTVANSGVAPFSWYADNLPFGLKLSTNGTLSGTATAIGSFTSDFVVMDSNVPPFLSHATLTLTVESDLDITTSVLPSAVVGTPYLQPIVNLGGLPPFTWAIVAGAPPTGLTIDSETGVMAGTPVTYNSTSDFNRTYGFTVQVTDAIGAMASALLSMTLSPAAFQFGNLDQPEVFANGQFEITIPLFGGKAPYTLSGFSDDGVIGSGLRLANPTSVAVVAGVEPPVLTGTTAAQTFFPGSYNFDPSFVLTATGGVEPFQFQIVAGAGTTLPGAALYADRVTALVAADGRYAVEVLITDGLGNTATQTIPVSVQQKNASPFAIKPVSVNRNGSNNPANWTVTVLPSLPDAKIGQPYNPGSGSYFGLALFQSNTLAITAASAGQPMIFSIRSGALPNGIVPFSGNSFASGTDASGIVLFNVSGGQNATSNGSFSFEAEFSGIVSATGALTQAVTRTSITVTSAGGGSTPVVVLTTVGGFTVDLSTSTGSALPWVFPLAAEGGQGPYSFSLQSGTTLPGAAIVGLNNLPAIASTTAGVGSFVAVVMATDANGVPSATAAIEINLVASPTEPIHLLDQTLPTYLYSNRPIPSNTYLVESDLQAAWSATGLPNGVSISTSTGTRSVLQGTPTGSGNFRPTVTATSIRYGTAASTTFALALRPQTAVFVTPPATAVVGTSYRPATNSAILSVAYTGYQPYDTNLPLPTSANGTVGSPSVYLNGTPTASVVSQTTDGFVMAFDYRSTVFGPDTITLGTGGPTITVEVVYPALVLTGATVATTVSEYSTASAFQVPATASGGLKPYTVTATGVSDARFSIVGGAVVVNATELPAGQTTSCSVATLAVDASGNSATATGVLQVEVRQETTITVAFGNGSWSAAVSNAPLQTSIAPNLHQSVPQLGHAPYQFYVDTVTLPPALVGFVAVSPSNRVLAIVLNANAASAQIADLDQTLAANGSFVVPAIAPSAAPAAGTYAIGLGLRVVDADGITASQTVQLSLTIS